MRVFQINHCSYGSTGMIMLGIHEELLRQGHQSWAAWPRGRAATNPGELRFNSEMGVRLHAAMGRLDDRTGFHSTRSTRELVRMVEEAKPDVVHLHNIHGYCLDVRVLFPALRAMHVPVVWTLHSCWPFTGHCSYFTYVKCEQWKRHCSYFGRCPQVHSYPRSILRDNSARNFDEKRYLFTGMPDMTIVTPSRWLAGLVGESFLREYPCMVIRNGIDTKTFRADIDTASVIARYGLEGKRVLLGVASPWSQRKGLEDMVRLRSLLGEEYAMVLVGLDGKQIKALPEGIVGIRRTDSPKELAELYAVADLFLNPTHEDNYPTVNIEALACGTRIVTYDTGGSPECTNDRETCIVTTEKTPRAMAEAVESHFASPHVAIAPRVADKTDCSLEYIGLYEDILARR